MFYVSLNRQVRRPSPGINDEEVRATVMIMDKKISFFSLYIQYLLDSEGRGTLMENKEFLFTGYGLFF